MWASGLVLYNTSRHGGIRRRMTSRLHNVCYEYQLNSRSNPAKTTLQRYPSSSTLLRHYTVSQIDKRVVLTDGSAHRVDRVLGFFSSRLNWDSPTPSPAGECVPPPYGSREGTHLLAEKGKKGWGGSQFGQRDRHCGTQICPLWFSAWRKHRGGEKKVTSSSKEIFTNQLGKRVGVRG